MKQELLIIDAFASRPFTGNPAAVCIVSDFPADALMQEIAMEMNLSETAFLAKRHDGSYDLRWFTPTCEVDLCGHATLASTHALIESGLLKNGDTVRFHTQSGILEAHAEPDKIELNFPAQPGETRPIEMLEGCLGVDILSCAQNATNLLAEVSGFDALLHCAPDMAAITQLPAQGLIVTTASGCGDYDFASRYFAPQVGIPEDPVCGSAHCMLAPYWAERLHKQYFTALQASKRSGELFLTLAGERVRIAGSAITTLKGHLELPALMKEKAA